MIQEKNEEKEVISDPAIVFVRSLRLRHVRRGHTHRRKENLNWKTWNRKLCNLCPCGLQLGGQVRARLGGKDENREKPERLAELENVLSGAPQAENTQTEEAQDGILQSFKNKVMAAEDDIEKYCNDKFLLYTPMRKLSNNFDRLAGWKLAYARTEGTTYTLNTGFDYQAVKEKDMSAYAENILAEADAAEHAGIPFLYVQYPYRVDEENSQVPWGADSYENENADAVLEQLRGASVDTLDLREALNEAGWDNNTGFYETDGHWTTRSGFESAGILADYLNTQYGFSYDPYYFEENSYKGTDLQSE